MIVRRERPHPGAQLSFTDHDGYRFQAILTDQTDPRHRGPGTPPPPTRPRRGPHPRRQGHRPGQVPVQGVRAQRGVASDRDARARPDRLDPSALPRRRARARPNPNACATDCCTSPPGSRSPDAAPSCTSPTAWPWTEALKAAFEKLKTLHAADRLTAPASDTHSEQTPRPPAAITAARNEPNTTDLTPQTPPPPPSRPHRRPTTRHSPPEIARRGHTHTLLHDRG